MSNPFVGEIKMFAGNFAPRSYAFCDGQLLAVSQNDALFSLLGTIYGGDGRTTFALPDMRGRVPVHAGTGPGLTRRDLGSKAGQEAVTLSANQMPNHSHRLTGNASAGSGGSPTDSVPAQSNVGVYVRNPNAAAIRPLEADSITPVGNNQSHTNLMPFQCINFIIALFGVYPSRS